MSKDSWKKKANPNPAIQAVTGKNAKRGQPNRKIAANLQRRIEDHTRMMATTKKPLGSLHRPGSMQK